MKRTPHYLWQLRPYLRQVAGQLTLGSISGIAMNGTVWLPMILFGRALDTLIAYGKHRATPSAVVHAALFYVCGILITEIPRIGKRWWIQTANNRMRQSIRADALRGVLGWQMDRLHCTPIGDLMARIIGDVEVLGVGLREFTTETYDTVLFSLSLVVAMCVVDVRLALWSLVPVPAAVLLAKMAGVWISRRTTQAREANAALTVSLQEQLAATRVLRLFGQVSGAIERVRVLSHKYADRNVAWIRLKGGLVPAYTTLMGSGIIFLLWFGGRAVISGAMTIGTFVAFYELFTKFTNRAFRIPQMMNTIQSGGAAYARLKPLLAPPLTMKGEPRLASFSAYHLIGTDRVATGVPGIPVPKPVHAVIEDVTFTYPGNTLPILADLRIDIPAGSLVAVTGPVGSGKSALARLMLGLYPLDSGQVLIDGAPLETIPPAERAARIGYLPQDPYLFSGTIAENVLMGEPAADPDLVAVCVDTAITRAALDDDLRGFPEGLRTQIGESGTRVSGGQRLRIALARSMASSCPVSPGLLVLDDPFSAVDVETESKIIQSLRDAYGPTAPPEQQATILLCSHRLAAFPLADQVIVLDQGRIAEQGTHDELMRAGGLYARIFSAQSRVHPAVAHPTDVLSLRGQHVPDDQDEEVRRED